MLNHTRLAALLLILALALIWTTYTGHASEGAPEPYDPNALTITGRLLDEQNRSVSGAQVELVQGNNDTVISETESQQNGAFILPVPPDQLGTNSLGIVIERHHFEPYHHELTNEELQRLAENRTLALHLEPLKRKLTLAFWLATLIFVGMLALIALEILHNALAALAGVSAVFAFSYLGGAVSEQFFIFSFERALEYVDWEVIFLIMGMMIVIAVVEGSGIFQWLAFFAYRISRGKAWLLIAVLMVITAITSAFLDNVTTMLLMTSITIRIALSLEMNPIPFLLPEVFASNVGGISTLVGTPTNILIGSFARIPFSSFLINLTPGVLMAMIVLILYVQVIWLRTYRQAVKPSPELEQLLRERSQITAPEDLKKAGWVGLGMLILFLFGERLHLNTAVTAILGATALLVWIKPDVEEMIEAVDWTTLVFFMSLFMMVGAIQEVGLLARITSVVADLVGTNLKLAMIAIVWVGAFMSMVVDNIPFTAAMLPVVGFLTQQIPNAGNALFFSLSIGSAMGGNGTLIGSSPNLVTAGIAERAGYPITYGTFLRYGLPGTILTLSVGTLWLLFHFG